MFDNTRKYGMSIFYILPQGFDFIMFAIVQAVATIGGLKVGNYSLPVASSVNFVEGYLSKDELQQEINNYDTVIDTSGIELHSILTHHEETKNTPFDPMKPVTNSKSVDDLVGWAQGEESPAIIFHDMASLTGGGQLCKPDDFKNLYDRLRLVGVRQIYFVSKEADIKKISSRPDLVFNVCNVNDEEQPTIRVTLKSAMARLQDSIMPVELVLTFQANGSWSVEETNRTKMQNEAIKALGFVGFNRIQIADKLGDLSSTTVGRRLKDMETDGEVILRGHDILPPKDQKSA